MTRETFFSHALSFASVAAVTGSVAYVAVTLLHPGGVGNDHPAIFRHYAMSQTWVAIHLAQLLAMVAGLVGLAGIGASMLRLQNDGRVLALLAIVLAVSSIPIAAVLQAVDGIALKRAVDAWVADGGTVGSASFAAARAIRWTEEGVNAMLGLTMGCTIILIGVAIMRDSLYPLWLGWTGVVVGIAVVIAAVFVAETGFSATSQVWVLARNPGLWIWTAVAGVVMWRRRLPLPNP